MLTDDAWRKTSCATMIYLRERGTVDRFITKILNHTYKCRTYRIAVTIYQVVVQINACRFSINVKTCDSRSEKNRIDGYTIIYSTAIFTGMLTDYTYIKNVSVWHILMFFLSDRRTNHYIALITPTYKTLLLNAKQRYRTYMRHFVAWNKSTWTGVRTRVEVNKR